MNEFSTLSSLWERREDAGAAGVEIEESSCLGGCAKAPCVGVEHEDFEGAVGLEGMTPNEFTSRV